MFRGFYILLACLLFPVLAAAARLDAAREAELHSAVTGFIQQKHANSGSEVSLKRFSVTSSPALPSGVLDYEVIAPQQWGGWGSANIAIIARQNERVIGNIGVRVEVEVLAEMVFAVRQMDAGTILATSDLVLRKHNVATVQGRYLAGLSDAAGKKLRMTVRANTPLRSDQLEKLPLIKTGQLVTIVAESERMRITVTGKARSSGALGDTIIVQNLNSLKEMPARIISADSVKIVY